MFSYCELDRIYVDVQIQKNVNLQVTVYKQVACSEWKFNQ